MAIKFHRPIEGYEENQIVELDATMEDYFVRRNYADFYQMPEVTDEVEVAEKPKKPKKVKE